MGVTHLETYQGFCAETARGQRLSRDLALRHPRKAPPTQSASAIMGVGAYAASFQPYAGESPTTLSWPGFLPFPACFALGYGFSALIPN